MILRPTYLIKGDITDIDLNQLAQDGIKGIILDLDSTLIAPRSGQLTPESNEWLERARKQFMLAVVSNNKKEQYINAVANLLNMPVIGRACKPSRKCLLQILEQFQLQAYEVAVVGDRPLTDVLGGLRAGMKTILVWPLKSMNEPSWLVFLRKLERCVIRS